MEKEVVCMVYYSLLSTEYGNKNLLENQRKLALNMLKKGFYDMFSIVLNETAIKKTLLGKPYYEGEENCYFNISHCHNAVVVAVSKFPIGVDVESMRKVKFGTIKKCCSTEELKYVIQENGKEKENDTCMSKEEIKRFLHLWTLKESFVKMTGEGLRMPVNTIDFDIVSFQKNGIENCISRLYLPKDLIVAVSIQCEVQLTDNEIIWQEYRSSAGSRK